MRKILIPLALLIAAVASVAAYAQDARQNQYKVTVSTSPSKAGKKKKPVTVGTRFGFTVTEVSGQRPVGLKRLTLDFRGINFNTRAFPSCTAAKIEQNNGSDSACPSGSLMGTGFANNLAGPVNDTRGTVPPNAQCYLTVKLYSAGASGATLFVQGNPNAPAGRSCPLALNVPIPISLVRRSTGTQFSFTIPPSLTNPGSPNITNALIETQVNIARKSRRAKIGGKRRKYGFLEAVGGCTGGQRRVTATFTNQDGSTAGQQGVASCRR